MNPSLHSYVTVNFEQLKIISKIAKIFIYQHRENGHGLNLWRVSKNALVAANLYPRDIQTVDIQQIKFSKDSK